MKSKNFILGITVVTFAIGSAIASSLLLPIERVHALIERTPGSPLECLPCIQDITCDPQAVFPCRIQIIEQVGGVVIRNGRRPRTFGCVVSRRMNPDPQICSVGFVPFRVH